MKKKRKHMFFTVGLGLVVLFLTLFIIANHVLQKKVRHNLEQLFPNSQVTLTSINTNLFTSTIFLNGLSFDIFPNSIKRKAGFSARFSRVRFTGVNLYKLLTGKILDIKEVKLEKSNITIDEFPFNNETNKLLSAFSSNLPFKQIFIKRLSLVNGNLWLNSEKTKRLLAKGDVNFHDFLLISTSNLVHLDSLHFSGFSCRLHDLSIPLQHTASAIYIRKLIMDSRSAVTKLDSVSIRPDKENAAYAKRPVPIYIDAFMSEIEFVRPNLMDLFHSQLTAEQMIINQASIKLLLPQLSVHRKLNSFIDFLNRIPFDISIKIINLRQTSLAFSNRNIRGQLIGNLSFYECTINQRSNNKTSLSISDVGMNLTHLRFLNSLYSVTINKLVSDRKKQDVTIDQLEIAPRYGKYEFSQRLGHQADRIECSLSFILIQNPVLSGLLDNKIIADKILLSGGHAYIFRDRRLFRSQNAKPLPVTFLKKLPWELKVNTLQVRNSSLVYEERPQDGGPTGLLRIERMQGSLSPLFNHPRLTGPSAMILKTEGSLMGSGIVYATFYLPLHSDNYRVKGAFKNVDLTKLNASSENLGKIHIKSGLLDSLGFQFEFNNIQSSGKITGEYHRLIIQQLKKSRNKGMKVARLRSFMLRHLIIPLNKDKSLPERKRTGKISYQHDPTRFLSHNLLHSLLTGIRSSFTLGFLLPK